MIILLLWLSLKEKSASADDDLNPEWIITEYTGIGSFGCKDCDWTSASRTLINSVTVDSDTCEGGQKLY